MSTISVRNVTKKYGAVTAIPDLTLDVAEGEFIVLVGPSGCGKSTLLRMLAGLESISAGDVAIDGEVVNNMMPRQRNIAMVFQSYALYPHMTVAGNMGFSLKLDGMNKVDVAKRVDEVSKILALDTLLDRKPAHLSGGQRQRVAMGRSIVRNPSVFLFDEPLSNLDAKLRVQMRAEIKSLHHRLGTTIVYVTHDQIEAMTMADRIVVMNAGNIEQVGPPLELYDYPANRFVAEFLGSPSMNLIDGIVSDKGALELSGGLSLPLGANVEAGAEVTLGIRPEYISLKDTGGMKARCKISVVEPTGPSTILVVDLDSKNLTIEVTGRVSHKIGETIDIWVPQDKCHLFDTTSGVRLDKQGEFNA